MRFLAVALLCLGLSACKSSPVGPVDVGVKFDPNKITIELTADFLKNLDFGVEPLPDGVQPIIGGLIAKPGEYQSVAFSGSCSGVLISPTWLLTAAHCGASAGQTWGWQNPVAGGARITAKAKRTVVPKEYRKDAFSLGYDICAVELVSPVVGITPAKLSATPAKVGRKINIAGYGNTGTGATGQTGGAGVLRYGEQDSQFVLAQQILTMFDRDEVASIALGDSGGAAFDAETGQLCGIASGCSIGAGGKVGVWGTYAFWTRLDANRNWIKLTCGV